MRAWRCGPWRAGPGAWFCRGIWGQPPAMATGREKEGETDMEGDCVYNCGGSGTSRSTSSAPAAAGGRRREEGRAGRASRREGFPDFALSPLRSAGAPGLGCAAEPSLPIPPSPALLGEPPHLVYGEGYSSSTLVIGSPHTPGCILAGDARLTDSRRSQSPPGPPGDKVDFPNALIGRRGRRALVIGVLLGVESSKQPWSRAELGG